MIIERTCNKCHETKPLDAFPPAQQRHGYRDNIRPICRVCISISAKIYRKEHREQILAHGRKMYRLNGAKQRRDDKIRRDRLKLEVFAHYGNVCYCCGETEPKFLTIDHKLNNGREARKNGYNGNMLYEKIKREGFPDDLQLACWNCNCGRGKNGGICPHEAARAGVLKLAA